MNIIVSRLDIKTTRERWPNDIPFAPALVLAKQPGQPEDWIAVDARVDADSAPSFTDTTSDQYLRIPLFEYMLSAEADLAFTAPLQIGLSCVGHIHKPIKTLHVVTGNPVDLIYGDDINTAVGLRYWLGFAIATER